MIPNMNLSQARSGGNGLDPDGFVVKVVAAYMNSYGQLQLDVDIAEGPHVGYYADLSEKFNFWGLAIRLYLDEKSAWKFAQTIDAFRASNPGFEWNDDGENDERKLIGKYVGVITQRRHYYGGDGTEKTSLIVYKAVPVDDIRQGRFTLPEKDSYSKDFAKMSAPQATGIVDTTMEIPESFRQSADETPF